MGKVVKCVICGRQFETARPNKKYCSFSCREAGRKLQRLKWEDEHPNYITKYMQKYRHSKKTPQECPTLNETNND